MSEISNMPVEYGKSSPSSISLELFPAIIYILSL